jgi:hypothetical protein
MAHPTTEVAKFRSRVTQLVEDLREVDAILAIVEDHGTNDTEREAFFTSIFGAEYDISWTTFANGVVALRAIRTARDANKIALAKLLE